MRFECRNFNFIYAADFEIKVILGSAMLTPEDSILIIAALIQRSLVKFVFIENQRRST